MRVKPTKDMQLDEEELEIQSAISRGEFRDATKDEMLAFRSKLETGARASVDARNKEARVNIRMTHADLEALKKIADYQGIPYQTLMGSVLVRFIHGRLVDRSTIDELRKFFTVEVGGVSPKSKVKMCINSRPFVSEESIKVKHKRKA
jgi:predicted DNA binding CopG/RHH family protein